MEFLQLPLECPHRFEFGLCRSFTGFSFEFQWKSYHSHWIFLWCFTPIGIPLDFLPFSWVFPRCFVLELYRSCMYTRFWLEFHWNSYNIHRHFVWCFIPIWISCNSVGIPTGSFGIPASLWIDAVYALYRDFVGIPLEVLRFQLEWRILPHCYWNSNGIPTNSFGIPTSLRNLCYVGAIQESPWNSVGILTNPIWNLVWCFIPIGIPWKLRWNSFNFHWNSWIALYWSYIGAVQETSWNSQHCTGTLYYASFLFESIGIPLEFLRLPLEIPRGFVLELYRSCRYTGFSLEFQPLLLEFCMMLHSYWNPIGIPALLRIGTM